MKDSQEFPSNFYVQSSRISLLNCYINVRAIMFGNGRRLHLPFGRVT